MEDKTLTSLVTPACPSIDLVSQLPGIFFSWRCSNEKMETSQCPRWLAGSVTYCFACCLLRGNSPHAAAGHLVTQVSPSVWQQHRGPIEMMQDAIIWLVWHRCRQDIWSRPPRFDCTDSAALSVWLIPGLRTLQRHTLIWMATLWFIMTETRWIQARNLGEVCACTSTNNGVTLVASPKSGKCQNIELLAVSCRPYYLPCEFSNVIVILVYIPPSANAKLATDVIARTAHKLPSQSSDTFNMINGDQCNFNHCILSAIVQAVCQLSYERWNNYWLILCQY